MLGNNDIHSFNAAMGGDSGDKIKDVINILSIPKEDDQHNNVLKRMDLQGLELGKKSAVVDLFSKMKEQIFGKIEEAAHTGQRKEIVELNHMIINFFVFANSVAGFMPSNSNMSLNSMLESIDKQVQDKFKGNPRYSMVDIDIRENYNELLTGLTRVEKALLDDKKKDVSKSIKMDYERYIESLNEKYGLRDLKNNRQYGLSKLMDEILNLEDLLETVVSSVRPGAKQGGAFLKTAATIVKLNDHLSGA